MYQYDVSTPERRSHAFYNTLDSRLLDMPREEFPVFLQGIRDLARTKNSDLQLQICMEVVRRAYRQPTES